MDTHIMNLKAAALKASKLELDHRFKQWVKFVDRVDVSKSDGYAFVGDFVESGTVEVPKRKRVLLCAAESGSMRYHKCYYQVCVLNADGTIDAWDIQDNNGEKGWALRMRQDIAELVADVDRENAA